MVQKTANNRCIILGVRFYVVGNINFHAQSIRGCVMDELHSLTKTEAMVLRIFRHTTMSGVRNGRQSSWDWDADWWFADEMGDEEIKSHIEDCTDSNAPGPIVIQVYECLLKKHTQKRIRALRSLVKKGYCESFWSGTGWAGKTDFGVNRVRVWQLSEAGMKFFEMYNLHQEIHNDSTR